jgi:ribose transport system permease protein
MWMSGTGSIPKLNDAYAFAFGGGNIGPIPILLLWALVFAFFGQLVLKHTVFGRRVLATGGNETAARYSGVNTGATKYYVLVLSSLSAALAGMLYADAFKPAASNLAKGMNCR